MYWYRLENDTKIRTVEDKFVKNPDQYFKIGVKTWSHLTECGIINAYGPKKDVQMVD